MAQLSIGQTLELIATTIPETLASKEALMMQIKTPYIASPDFYNSLAQDLNGGLTAGRVKLFNLENHGRTESYTLQDYGQMGISTIKLPEKKIVSGEFSYGAIDRLLDAEAINRWAGDKGYIKMFTKRKLTARLPQSIAQFQKYIELKFLMENLCYSVVMSDDGTTAVPHSISTKDNTQGNFEVFNTITTKVRNLIGSPVSSYLLQVMSDTTKTILYAGTASNRLGEYGSDMLDKMTRNIFEDRLNGTTVTTSHWEILNHIPGTAMPSIPNRTTNNPDISRNYTIKNVTFNYNADLYNSTAGTITIACDDPLIVGKTIKTGDVFFIKNSALTKALNGYEASDFMMPIVMGPEAVINTTRPDSQLIEYRPYERAFNASKEVTFNFCGNWRPKLANNDDLTMSYNENFIFDKTSTDQSIHSTTLVSDLVDALKNCELIPLALPRKHVLTYPPKKMWVYPRIVTLPNEPFSDAVMKTALSQVPQYGEMMQVSALPITARFNTLRSQGFALDIELYSESACEFDNYNHNLGAVCIG
jgi:hypothetical protein